VHHGLPMPVASSFVNGTSTPQDIESAGSAIADLRLRGRVESMRYGMESVDEPDGPVPPAPAEEMVGGEAYGFNRLWF